MIDCSEGLKNLYKKSSVKKNLRIKSTSKDEKFKNYSYYNGRGQLLDKIEKWTGYQEYDLKYYNFSGTSWDGITKYITGYSADLFNVYDSKYKNIIKLFQFVKKIYFSIDCRCKSDADISTLGGDYQMCFRISAKDLKNKIYYVESNIVEITAQKGNYVNMSKELDIDGILYGQTYNLEITLYLIPKFESTTNYKNNFDEIFTLAKGQLQFSFDSESVFPVSYPLYRLDCSNSDLVDNIYKYASEEKFDLKNDNIVSESFSMTESLCSTDNLKFGCCESSYCDFNFYGNYNLSGKEFDVIQTISDGETEYNLKLGRFICTETSKQWHGTEIERQVTAYDGLYKLQENAMDWYTSYMFGFNTASFEDRYGIEYTRQIFSTYYNFAKSIGIEKDTYYGLKKLIGTDMTSYAPSFGISNTNDTRFYYFSMSKSGGTVDNYDISKPFMVKLVSNDSSGEYEPYLKGSFSDYLNLCDSLGRGFGGNCSIFVKETLSNGKTNKFVVNSGDQFMLSPNNSRIDIYFPWVAKNNSGSLVYITKDVYLYQVERDVNLTNASTRLMYYNWSTREIFSCDSSVTGRQVIHSVLEPTGCFFKLDRDGKPTFKYCTKTALYPSESLYPANNLYPRGSDEIANRGMYEYFHCEDYEVKDFGKIQIVKNTNSNESKSIVEWTYVGDSSKENTYLIDDNIFYCHADMEYEYDSMTEVSEMLSNMFERIKDIGYTPMTASCVGMPYLECGDRIVLLTENSGIESFIFSRTLKGIQALKDTYESKGDEVNAEINDFGYSEFK